MYKRETKPLGFMIFVLTTACLSASIELLAQSPGARKDPFTLKIPVNLVLVPVSVKDRDDQPLYGLGKEDFQISEEGILQHLSYFSSDPLPLSAVLLIDRSLDPRAQSRLKETLLALIESFSDFDELAVFKFDHTPDKLLDFTLDKNKVLETFQKKIAWAPRSPGVMSGPFSPQTTVGGIEVDSAQGTVQPPKTWNTHIDDAMFAAAQALRERRNRESRKMILIISEGRNAPGNRNPFDDTLEAILRAEIVVYGIAQGTSFFSGNALSKYAKSTGGEVYLPIKTNTLAKTYQKITQSARNQYVLGYIPNTPPTKVSFRRIRVELADDRFKNLKVRSRKGYYAIPPL